MAGFELTLGARHLGDGRTRFRVWAPDRRTVDVAIEEGASLRFAPLGATSDGYFEGVAKAAPGTRYRYRLDGRECFPDPCSRFQPDGPHGPSRVVDVAGYAWRDAGWPGLERRGNVLYELHVGTFTGAGNYAGLRDELGRLRDLGVTAIELMPLHAFPGRFNWGYDGVNLFAPFAGYGSPEELCALVDACHAQGLGALLDVVYNHLGPDGNYLRAYSRAYFSERHSGEWGEPLNYDGPGSAAVRDWVIQNACYWIDTFHFDGLRLDATHAMPDESPVHVLAELGPAVRRAAAPRKVLLIAESETQDSGLLDSVDAMWIDDFHHAAKVAATGQAEAYLSDFRGDAQELVACARHNAVYQGQRSAWRGVPRGSPLSERDPERFVFFLQNHDQIAHSLRGERLHSLAGPAVARALTTYLLLLPQTPLLFMGQEYFASTPFLYFVDHGAELDGKVRAGRQAFLSSFASIRAALEREGARIEWGAEAFERSRLDRRAREGALAFHQTLLQLRRSFPPAARLDGAALDDRALVLRWFGDAGTGDRLLLLNLGATRPLAADQPLLAPPNGARWAPLFSSEDSRYGGGGAIFPLVGDERAVQGRATCVLTSWIPAARAG